MKQYEKHIDKEKAMYSAIFLLANLGGSAKREVIGEFLIDIFGIDEKQIEKDAQNWLNDIRLEMIDKGYILESQKDKNGIWELTPKAKIEVAKTQVTFFLFWEKLKEIYKD
jgi:hypothetical protein